ncbi:hypothetical protein ABZP36_029907 [Zizania latifolia]
MHQPAPIHHSHRCAALSQRGRYFRMDPLPGRNALLPSQPGEKIVQYPIRPVDTTTDFEGTTSLQPTQPPSGNAVPGNQSMVPRPIPRQMQQPMVGIQRITAGANMAAFSAASQASMAGLNPGNIPMQRGAGAQSHPHQVK